MEKTSIETYISVKAKTYTLEDLLLLNLTVVNLLTDLIGC